MKNANRIISLFFICAVPFWGNAQKLWDGEANDGKWNSDSNWYPNGVPLITDDVILNNNFINTPYTVTFPIGATTIDLSTLKIQPNGTNEISLNIPDVNTASPALSVNNIIIGNRGVLINNSGATAGNTFLINGGMKIEDGGKYIHRTIRGNANLISKLIFNKNNKNGVIEFDVPGTSGYTVSLSGRSFGTLILNANKAGGKKTYSGSGNGNLTIYGNIETGIGAAFTSSLNGNILISGNLTNRGIISLSPSSVDSIGRELIFNGDSSTFFSNGVFQQNSSFRKIRIAENARLQFNSSLIISNPNTLFEVSTKALFLPDTAYLLGGIFKADSLSILSISSPDGISLLPNTGNMRSNSFNFHPSVCIMFEKEGNQSTGNAFPQIISSLFINKPSGKLTLNNNLLIKDSIDLSRGKIYSSNQFMITLAGKFINKKINQYGWYTGSEESFISGPMKIITDTTRSLVFPIGKDDVFAPVSIYKNTPDSATYILEYFKEKTPNVDSLKVYPLKTINENEYWTLQKSSSQTNQSMKEVLSISRRENSLVGLTGQPVIASFSDIEKKWFAIPQSINGLTKQLLTGISTTIKSGCFTFGGLETQALPFEKFTIAYSLQDKTSKVSWTNTNDSETEFYSLEKSNDGKKFIQLAKINSSKKTETYSYQYECQKNEIEGAFLRVLAYDKSEKPIVSNTIFIKRSHAIKPLYPNPAVDKIFLPANDSRGLKKLTIISQDGKIFKPDFSKERDGYSINIEMLPKGVFVLACEYGSTTEFQTFIKS